MTAPQHRTKAWWSRLDHPHKEDAWYAIHGAFDDPRFPVPITTTADALAQFAPHLLATVYKDRSVPRRGYLAALKGGHCEMTRLKERRPVLAGLPDCNEQIRDFRTLRLWEFNHVVPRSFDDTQFVISGSSLCRRSWAVVREHALRDTVLLCRECHWRVTNLEKQALIIANREIYGAPSSNE